MSDKEHALHHRGPMFEFRDLDSDMEYAGQDGDGNYVSHASARWPDPFDDDDLDQPEDEMWWHNE